MALILVSIICRRHSFWKYEASFHCNLIFEMFLLLCFDFLIWPKLHWIFRKTSICTNFYFVPLCQNVQVTITTIFLPFNWFRFHGKLGYSWISWISFFLFFRFDFLICSKLHLIFRKIFVWHYHHKQSFWNNKQQSQVQSNRFKIPSSGVPITSNQPILGIFGQTKLMQILRTLIQKTHFSKQVEKSGALCNILPCVWKFLHRQKKMLPFLSDFGPVQLRAELSSWAPKAAQARKSFEFWLVSWPNLQSNFEQLSKRI